MSVIYDSYKHVSNISESDRIQTKVRNSVGRREKKADINVIKMTDKSFKTDKMFKSYDQKF